MGPRKPTMGNLASNENNSDEGIKKQPVFAPFVDDLIGGLASYTIAELKKLKAAVVEEIEKKAGESGNEG